MSRGQIDWFQAAIAAKKAPAASDLSLPMPARPLRPLTPGLFSIAPMIDKTDRHFRYFLRLLTKRTILYTEMVTAPAIIHGKRRQLLDFRDLEGPLVLQLGGDDPQEVAEAVKIAEDWPYGEYNLNVGCPSDKVQRGSFGACLMADPTRVAKIVEAMAAVTAKPVTVKHRVGINGFGYSQESYAELADFVRTVAAAGCERFIVHARIAMLEGLSPKENRTVPPLRYQDVYDLKRQFPALHIEINGQVGDLPGAAQHLSAGMDGVMFGRASYEKPWLLAGFDDFMDTWQANDEEAARRALMAGQAAIDAFDRSAAIMRYAEYIDSQVKLGLNPRSLIWPVLDLFPGVRGSRKFKQLLSQPYRGNGPVSALVRQALSFLEINSRIGAKP